MCWIFKFRIGVLNSVLEIYILYWRFKFGIGDFYGMHKDVNVFFRASPGYVGLPITSFQKHKKVLIVFRIY